MSAHFVALALSYSAVYGTLALKGAKKRPWLEIRLCERDRTYLRYIGRRLRSAHDGPLDLVYDIVPGESFYDVHRLRFHSPELYRVYELLYPRDCRHLSAEAMEIGARHLVAALWTQGGCERSKGLHIEHRRLKDDRDVVCRWLEAQGIPIDNREVEGPASTISFPIEETSKVKNWLRPYLPPHRTPSLYVLPSRRR